jgi:diguanylate cyclase (GGDEF)-like protein
MPHDSFAPEPTEQEGDEPTSVTRVGGQTIPISAGVRGRRERKPYLVVLIGSNVGETFRLDPALGQVLLGRGPASTIRFGDDGVSRRHASLHLAEAGAWRLEDLDSANGTHVNGERVKAHILAENDRIHLGPNTLLKFTYHDELEENFQRQMFDAALRDGLTKAFNRKYFLTRLDTELAYSRRHGSPLSLLMLDVDHFKKVNDTYGHLAGDSVLATLAQLVTKTIRAEDVFARYGGEEFAVICRGVGRDQACVLAERLRQVVDANPFDVGDGASLRVSISVGVAGMPEFAAESSLQLVAAADEALYGAKRGGRNRITRYGPPSSRDR